MERSDCPAEREGVYSPTGARRRRKTRPQNAAVCESADGDVSLGPQLNQARLERFTWTQCFFALPFLIALIDYFGAGKIIAVLNHTKLRNLNVELRRPETLKPRPGYASLPGCSLGERRIYRNQTCVLRYIFSEEIRNERNERNRYRRLPCVGDGVGRSQTTGGGQSAAGPGRRPTVRSSSRGAWTKNVWRAMRLLPRRQSDRWPVRPGSDPFGPRDGRRGR